MTSIAVFESPTEREKRLIYSYMEKGAQIYILEPFYAYHHRGVFRFYPPPLPDYIEDLIRKKKLSLITADEIDSRGIYAEAADKAVAAIEKVYPLYQKSVTHIIRFVSSETGSGVESAFKKNLCDRLGDFFSVNLLIQRIERLFGTEAIEFYPNTDTIAYQYYRKLTRQSGCSFFDCNNIIIPTVVHKKDALKRTLFRIKLIIKLVLQTIGSLLAIPWQKKKRSADSIKNYKFGISIVAPRRQFRKNQRGVDFLVDNKSIRSEDVIYLPMVDLDEKQKQRLNEIGSDVAYLPRIGRFFSNWAAWVQLVILGTKNGAVPDCGEIELAAICLFTYFRWQNLLKDIHFDHFITHSDFANSHIARNLLFRQNGTTTWYFTDASNFGHSFRTDEKVWNCHPFWAFQDYDNLLTWNEDLAYFFSRHPQSYRKTHVIGSLWSSHVDTSIDRLAFLPRYFGESAVADKFVIIAYSSTYTVNGITSYQEGIEFARHIEKLGEEFEDVLILLKEKKETDLHIRLDPKRGSELLKIYERMNRHPRIKICSNQIDTSEAMAICDLCISFPYTSTTNEAIGFRIPSIWHDPSEYYRKTPYAMHGNLVTHGYSELRQKVVELKSKETGEFQDPTDSQSSLFDPYRDGKAIERFRALLSSEYDG